MAASLSFAPLRAACRAAAEILFEGPIRQLGWKIRLYLDAAALHPSWRIGPSKRISAAAPVLRPGKAVEVALLLSSPNGELQDAPCIPGRLPAGAEACFTITDHCDFDSTERLRLFLHGDPERRGWLDRGLRLTKSAFALPCKSAPERRAASLCDSEYRGLMETLLLDGSEVAPHGLSLMGTVEPAEFEQALAEFARAWRPGVWIDHGCGLPYCYANGGAYDMRYRLLNRLRQHGFTGLWAYHDAPSDPHRLNLLAPRPATFLGVAGVLARHLQERRAGVALHYVRTAIEQRLDGLLRYPLQELISTVRIAATSAPHSQALRRAIAGLGRILRTTMRDYRLLSEPYRLQELIDLAPIAYPERRVPLNQAREDDLLLFSTAEVSHAADAYTAAAVHLLAEARGIHIGHCYLLNPRSYISGPIERKNGRDRLKASWCAFLDSLSSLVSTGQVWNPTVTQLLAWLRSVQAVECMPEGASSIRLTNTGSREIRDYTVLVPPGNQPENLLWAGAEPKGVRWWWDWVAVWGDLPAHSETVVTWMAGTGARRPLATALG